MDGATLRRKLADLLDEPSAGTFLTLRSSYDYLYAAVQDFNFRTHYATTTQTITIVPGTAAYNLNPDYVDLAFEDEYGRKYVQYTSSGSTTALFNRDYQEIVLENSTATAAVAGSYSITDASPIAPLTGTTTATESGGIASTESLLVDSTADFSSATPGDIVHDLTTEAEGYVIADPVSSTKLATALFLPSGATSTFTSGDTYVLNFQPRYQIVLSPVPSAAATLSVPYVSRPDPVYSPYRAYNLPYNYMMPLIQFAAFLYKYRDREPNYGDALFRYYDGFVRRIAVEMRRNRPERMGFRISFKKLDPRSRSMGNWN